MENSRWKLNKERGEHLLLAGLVLLIFGCMGSNLVGDISQIVGGYLLISSCWVFFWVFRSGKFIRLPKWGLHLFLGINAFMTVGAMIVTIGTILFSW